MRLRKIAGIVLSVIVGLAASAKIAGSAGEDDTPANIEKTYTLLSTLCIVPPFCPVSREALDTMQRAIAGDASAEYLFGLTLLTGDGLAKNREAGFAWVARAAEHGDPGAARDIDDRLRNGASVEVDETKIATALQRRAEAGDREAMRALGPMIMRGRGIQKDAAGGLAMLQHAASLGLSGAEADLARLYTMGAPGVPRDRRESLKWYESAARHGDVEAMVALGYLALNSWNSSSERDLNLGFCWLMRAALLDDPQAQEKLSMMFASGETDDHGARLGVDLAGADVWFRLAARSPFHDNSQIRAAIEPNMTTDEIGAAKRLVDGWRPRSFEEIKTLDIPLPPTARGGASAGKCRPMG
jgi:TPR repeat protein